MRRSKVWGNTMNDDTQTNESQSETGDRHLTEAEERYLWEMMTKLSWFVLFLIGGILLVLSVIGTVYNQFNGLHGTQSGGLLTAVMPFYIGIPATLLFIVYSLVYRLHRFMVYLSVTLLLAHLLLFALNFVLGVIACC